MTLLGDHEGEGGNLVGGRSSWDLLWGMSRVLPLPYPFFLCFLVAVKRTVQLYHALTALKEQSLRDHEP